MNKNAPGGAGRKARRSRREKPEWDARSLRDARSYGFFWYDWLWRVVRPALVFICAGLVLFGGIAYAGRMLYQKYIMPVDAASTQTESFVVESGMSLTSVANRLEEQGIIRNHSVLKYLMDFQGLGQKIQAGEYQLSRSMSIYQIIEQLTTGDGKPLTRNITVIPGWTIQTIAKRFAEEGIIPDEESFLNACRTGEEFSDYYYVMEVMNTPKVNQRFFVLEGYLSPDTYQVYTNAPVNDIIRKLLSQTDNVFSEAYRERASVLGMTMDQVLTLASMIEKEAKLADFAKVSAVFHNRLDKNMALGSDVTVQYSTGSDKMALTNAELSVISAYNTYTNTGLPVGPVCSPSKAAIDAALNPDVQFLAESYLYFCSTTPDSGELYFSKTLDEHNAAVARYRPLWEEYDRNRGV